MKNRAESILRHRRGPTALTLLFLAATAGRGSAVETTWTGSAGGGGQGAWSTSGNWTGGVPSPTVDAILPAPLAVAGNNTITLGSGAAAKSLVVRGGYDPDIASVLRSGTLSLADTLSVDGNGAYLAIGDGAGVSTPSAVVGLSPSADSPWLEVSAGASLTIAGRLDVGYDGSGATVYANGANITVGTLVTGGAASSVGGRFMVENQASLRASQLVVGDAGTGSYSTVYDATLTTGTTTVGNAAGADGNQIDVAEAGHWDASGPLTIGKRSAGNIVTIGYDDGMGAPNVGTLTVTGTSSDVVLGAHPGADGNMLFVEGEGSSFSSEAAVVVGGGGADNGLHLRFGGAAASASGMIGVGTGADRNAVSVTNGSTWTVAGTLLVGDGGSGNRLTITNGSVVATGSTVRVGDGSGHANGIVVGGEGAELAIAGTASDLVVGGGGQAASVTIGDGAALQVGRSVTLGSLAELSLGTGAGGGVCGAITVGGSIDGVAGALVRVSNDETGAVPPYVFTPTMTGALSFVHDGAGTSRLTAASSYSGTTAILAGILVVDGDLAAASGNVTVSGATLGGAGTIGGDTTVTAGGHVSPGFESWDTLKFLGNVDLASGATLDIEAFSPGLCDSIDVRGDLLLGTTVLDLTFDIHPAGTFVIARYGTLSGTFATIDANVPLDSFVIDYDYHGLHEIVVYTTPELDPGCAAAVIAFLVGALGCGEHRATENRDPSSFPAGRRRRG